MKASVLFNADARNIGGRRHLLKKQEVLHQRLHEMASAPPGLTFTKGGCCYCGQTVGARVSRAPAMAPLLLPAPTNHPITRRRQGCLSSAECGAISRASGRPGVAWTRLRTVRAPGRV